MVNLVKLVMNGLLELLFIQQSAVTYHSFRSHVISLSLYILFGTLVALIRFIILFFLYYFLILVDLFQAKSRLLFFLSFFKHNYYKIYITLAQSCNFLNISNRFPKIYVPLLSAILKLFLIIDWKINIFLSGLKNNEK